MEAGELSVGECREMLILEKRPASYLSHPLSLSLSLSLAPSLSPSFCVVVNIAYPCQWDCMLFCLSLEVLQRTCIPLGCWGDLLKFCFHVFSFSSSSSLLPPRVFFYPFKPHKPSKQILDSELQLTLLLHQMREGEKKNINSKDFLKKGKENQTNLNISTWPAHKMAASASHHAHEAYFSFLITSSPLFVGSCRCASIIIKSWMHLH